MATGDLMQEEAILDWVLELSESTPDVIESVDRKTLQMLINDVEHLAVFFCKLLIEYLIPFLITIHFLGEIFKLDLLIHCWKEIFVETGKFCLYTVILFIQSLNMIYTQKPNFPFIPVGMITFISKLV